MTNKQKRKTGKFDINGTEIVEGDIIRAKNVDQEWTVHYDSKKSRFIGLPYDALAHLSLDQIVEDGCYIVANKQNNWKEREERFKKWLSERDDDFELDIWDFRCMHDFFDNEEQQTLQEVEEKNKKDSFYGLEVKKSNLIPNGEIWIGTGDENFIKIQPNLSAIKQEEV